MPMVNRLKPLAMTLTTICHFKVDRTIEFKQDKESVAYRYALSNQQAKMGDYIYRRDLGAFLAVTRVLHPNQLKESHPVITSTNNPKYITIYNKDL